MVGDHDLLKWPRPECGIMPDEVLSNLDAMPDEDFAYFTEILSADMEVVCVGGDDNAAGDDAEDDDDEDDHDVMWKLLTTMA